MQPGQPSRTALGAASHRAAHQVLENGSIFADPLALRILGPYAETALERAKTKPARRRMRLYIAVRTRFAEDALAAAVDGGATQLVVLGAGLDTFAYRSPFAERLRVFEVDHPATQAWKREQLATAAIAEPAWLTFAPIDFEGQTLDAGLAAAGFDPTRTSFFTWLGVVPYLSESAVSVTLGFIARLEGGAEVVFDYANPPAASDPGELTALRAALAERVATLGESLRSAYETDALHTELRTLGFATIEDLGPVAIGRRYFGLERANEIPDRGGHVLRAVTR